MIEKFSADTQRVEETALTVRDETQLPATLEELAQFVLFNEEKVKLARATIKAIDKLGVAKDVVAEKLREAQDIADLVALAKIKLGELIDALPTCSGARTDLQPVDKRVRRLKTKSEAIAEIGLERKQANRLQTMARNPDAVHAAMAKAREAGDVVSQSQILSEIKRNKKQQEIIEAKASVAAQYTNAEEEAVLFVGDGINFTPDTPYKLLITDPPYSTDVADIDTFAQSWLPNALSHVRRDGFAYVFVGAYPAELKAYLSITPPEHMTLEQILVWTYRNTLGNAPKYYKQNWQACLFFRGVDSPAIDCPITAERWAVQDVNAPDGRIGNRYHEWQKPDEIAERFVRHSTQKGDTVFDPFACTGTFLLTAAKLGRKAYGFEVNPEHAAIAFSRGCRRGVALKEKMD